MISQSKLDDTFPLGQFYVEVFTMPYRLDRHRNEGGVIIYVREDIPSKILERHKLPQDVEGMFVKLKCRKSKWMLFGTYYLPSQNHQYLSEALDKALDCYSSYDRIVLIGDFNSEDHETCMETFLYQHNLTNIVKEGTCFKNSSKPSTIDLFLTNNSSYFQNTKTFFTGLSDFHKLVTTTLKISIPKNKPLQINYRNYKHFNNDSFNEDLKLAFNNTDIQTCEEFEEIFMNLLDHHAPLKKKILRANNAPYITKKLRKEIMKRSQLENIYTKALTEESLKAYTKQKNYVSRLYKKERKMFFNSLNPSVISDNRKFWKTVKPLFSNKGNYGNKIKLGENEEIIHDETKVAEELNTFFKTVVVSLDIHGNPCTVENVENMSDPVEKAIKKNKFHLSILLIKNRIDKNVSRNLFFNEVTKAEVPKEINYI